MKANSKHIQAVEAYGICGYQVQFSISDLYQLNYLARTVFDRAKDDTPEMALAEAIGKLMSRTIACPGKEFDFLTEDSAE